MSTSSYLRGRDDAQSPHSHREAGLGPHAITEDSQIIVGASKEQRFQAGFRRFVDKARRFSSVLWGPRAYHVRRLRDTTVAKKAELELGVL